ncbi:MAG: hypothetical protein P4L84_00720 [Isosphaeraceae bacterium]|nr:hypothetical protein [Isosphaeraceae bacterium]
MSKMAIFAEGYTEVVFVERLINELANQNHVRIDVRAVRGGTNVRRTCRLVRAGMPHPQQNRFVLIYDCGGDVAVKTRMMEEYDNLIKASYVIIICLRDVRPKYQLGDVHLLRQSLPLYVKTRPVTVHFLLSIMEIEAWFLAEATHYERIDPSITIEVIKNTCGFDPVIDDMQLRPFPANDLNNCYSIGGKIYEKANPANTVASLDYNEVCLNIAPKFNDLQRLIDLIGGFLF